MLGYKFGVNRLERLCSLDDTLRHDEAMKNSVMRSLDS